jgi:hypothetical protein
MVEASSKLYTFTDRASTEKWLAEHSIEFNVSDFRKFLLSIIADCGARSCVYHGGHEGC